MYVCEAFFFTEAGVGIGEILDCVDVFCCFEVFGADCFLFARSVQWLFYCGCHIEQGVAKLAAVRPLDVRQASTPTVRTATWSSRLGGCLLWNRESLVNNLSISEGVWSLMNITN
jgi:hypothetical protein